MGNPGDGGKSQPTAKNLLIFPTRKILLNKFTSSAMKSVTPSLVLIAGFRAGLARLNLSYPENPALLGSLMFSYVCLSWFSWVF